MQHKYTYSGVDRALRDFLAFLLMLLTVVVVAAAIGIVSGVDTGAIDTQMMGLPVHTFEKIPDQAQDRVPSYTIQPIEAEMEYTGQRGEPNLENLHSLSGRMFLDAYAES